MKKSIKKNIVKKAGALVAAGIMTMGIAIPTIGANTYHHFFDSTATINSSTVKSTSSFKSSKETHMVQLHPTKVSKSGAIYAHRHKKGVIFWSETECYKFNISTTQYYQSGKSSKLNGTYYYSLSNYDRDSTVSSEAVITFNQGFVKEQN